jgi:uncharacterized protein
MKALAFANLNGHLEALERLQETVLAEEPDLVVFAGNAAGLGQALSEEAATTFDAFFRALAALRCPTAIVPGEHDAPERLFLPAAVARTWTERGVHVVHGSFTFLDNLAVVGFGGLVTDNEREVERALGYPAWEMLYRMSFLSEIDQQLLMVFHHPPAKTKAADLIDGRHTGSLAITELIGTWRPKVAVVGGPTPAIEVFGDTLVISPGRFDQGDYAVFDPRSGRGFELRNARALPATP